MLAKSAINRIFLRPSQAIVSQQRSIIITVLGSCISICLHDIVNHTGAISHFMLPIWTRNRESSLAYGDISTHYIVRKMLANGSEKKNLTARIFGGAHNANHFSNVGEKNIFVAKSLLQKSGISIRTESVGGEKGRKIIFDTFTGKVKMNFIEYARG